MKRIILHVDMDAFFAAIEELDNPSLAGKPVIVGADPKGGRGRGVVSTCNYEARKFGVHSAMPISRAFRACPHGEYLIPRGGRYGEVSRQVMNILRQFSPDVEQISVDEAFLDATGTERLFGDPETLGRRLKAQVRQETQLTASVGIAPNKFIAKIASDLEKPDGLTIVREEEMRDFLRPLSISRMWGVGRKTAERLAGMGINTFGDLADLSLETLAERFGASGYHFWQLAQGIDDRPVASGHTAKSISQERTYGEDEGDPEVLERTIHQLSEELSRLMRKQGYKGKTLTMKIRLDDFSTFTRSKTLRDFTNVPSEIRTSALRLFREFDRSGKKVRLLGIGMSNLNTVGGEQLSLLEGHQKENALNRVMDEVRSRFGRRAMEKAALMKDKK